MKSSKTDKPERQIDTDAQDFAQEVNYAVTHGGRELHPGQQEQPKHRKAEQADQAEPWQID